ncbi:MAG: IS5/IS1182 family transposase, partial [Natronococcus sp.]
ASEDPRRIFKVTTQVAAEAGLVGVKRVLDSAPLFDAVATMDTVTLIRSSIRGLLKAADAKLETRLRGLLSGDDDYAAAGKPACDWNDAAARARVVDRLAVDGLALLGELEGREVPTGVAQAAELVATVIGQDIEERADGRFVIARRVAPDRVISTVDPDARHGHKTTSRKYDGYKGHVAVD